jgi:hypothetical protein
MAGSAYVPVAFSLTGGGIDLNNLAGIAAAPTDLALDTFPNTGKEIFVHINADSSSRTVTFTENKCSLGIEHDKTETTLAGKAVPYGPFPTSKFGNTIAVAYDGTTISSGKVTIVVLQSPIVG